MACEMFDRCTEFFARYMELDRNEISDFYKMSYCLSDRHLSCKRREFFVQKQAAPHVDLTPSGCHSLLIRNFI